MRDQVRTLAVVVLVAAGGIAAYMLATAQSPLDNAAEARLQELRNLGKAFYETPGSSRQAVERLAEALELNPGSAREHLNYGLALLRAGQREEGMAQVAMAQRIDRTLPHTYFNLGIEYKKAGEVEKALDQFLQMDKLVPDEAKTQYNLGALYKQQVNIRRAIERFERTIELDPSLAAPHFQLFGILRRTDPDRAMHELETFKALKAKTEDAAVGEDVDWSFYAELHDPSLHAAVSAAAAPFEFASRQVATIEGEPRGAIALDLDGDGTADGVVWSAEAAAAVAGSSSGNPGIKSLRLGGALHYGAGDFDGDGLADLCRVDADGAEVLVNRSGRSFEPIFASEGDFDMCLFVDYDRDGDFDLFGLGRDRRLWRNNGDGGMSDATSEFPFAEGRVRAAATAELFEDNGHDVVAVYGDRILVHQDRKLGVFGPGVPVDGVSVPDGPVRMDVVDADHDGYLDIAVSTQGETAVLENRDGSLGPVHRLDRVQTWADFQLRGRLDGVTAEGFLAGRGGFEFAAMSAPGGAAHAAAADLNGDGRPDLLAATADGTVLVRANRTETSNRGLTVRLEGVKSPAIGTDARVEVKAGLAYTKQVYAGSPLHFGLGAAESVDTVRVTWANGLIQNETPEGAAAEIHIKEAPRLSGSCPMVYTWNGSRFEYISEVLGVAPLGASLARGVYFPVDHDEYVTVRGDQLKERAGYLDVRITEELRETAYLDKIRLLAIDHPADMRVVSNEKAKAPPFPDFRLFGVRSEIRPVAATNHSGESVLDLVVNGDRRYAPFRRDLSGRAEPHSLTLEFPHFDDVDAVLFLEAWVDWASASTIVAASQAESKAIQPPSLEIRSDDGQWHVAVADVGLPGGTLRTVAVDLSGKFPGRSRAVRIRTNMCVHWDKAYIATGTSDPNVRQTALEPSLADLRFRGFSRNFVPAGRDQPEQFDYQVVSATSNWNPTPGLYTRFGDVRELLRSEDDRFVIMGAGDEIQLRFRADQLPAVQPGWTRDYLLLVDGWAKENEANTAFGDSVTPLPFHSMSGYPYAADEQYPESPQHQEDLIRYHTRPAMRLLPPLVARASAR